MKLSKKEKNALFELMDVMSDSHPRNYIGKFFNDEDREIFSGIFKKLRLELRGL